jgi:hypothetical protein
MTSSLAKAELPERRRPMVLVPYDRKEAMTLQAAAKVADRCEATVKRWCGVYHLGRRVGNGPWRISRVALRLFLDGDEHGLSAYLRGDRTGPLVAPYFAALKRGENLS